MERKQCVRPGCLATVDGARRADRYCTDLCRAIDRTEVRLAVESKKVASNGKDMALIDQKHDALQKVISAVNEFRALFP